MKKNKRVNCVDLCNTNCDLQHKFYTTTKPSISFSHPSLIGESAVTACTTLSNEKQFTQEPAIQEPFKYTYYQQHGSKRFIL